MLTTHSLNRRCRTGGTPTFGTTSPGILSSSRTKLSLRSYCKPRNTYNFNHIENVPFGRPKRFKIRRINSYQKMDTIKKKIPDYTETAYRDAVARLKYLLAETYTPRTGKISRDRGIYRRSNTRLHESADDTDDRSVSDCSKGLSTNLLSRGNTLSDKNRLPLSLALTGDDSQMTPKELSALVMRQEEYIEQLENESQYCKEELKNLLSKVREVVAENESLHDKNKASLLKSFLTQVDGQQEDLALIKDTKKIDKLGSSNLSDGESTLPGKKIKLHLTPNGPSIIYESRISELEAQLTQARIELRKAQEDNRMSGKKMIEDTINVPSPETVAQLDQILKEKRDINTKLEEALKNLQNSREKEVEAAHKAKRAIEAAQTAEYEKNAAETEIRRLKDELDRQRERIRESTQETSRRLTEERHAVERRYSHQVEQLTADVAIHWDAASKSQLELDRHRREIKDLKRELSAKQAIIDDLKKELQLKTSNLQSEVNQIAAEKDAVEQELATAKLAAERNERHARQEQNRWQSETNSYKHRLERADADIVHCRRENLRLTEQIASLEKELNMEKIIHSEAQQSPKKTPRPDSENKELTSMIMDMETKHAATVAGLEDSLSHQAKLVSRLTDECQSLTQRLEANDRKHKEEMASLQNNIELLTNKIQETFSNQQGKSSNAESSQNIPLHTDDPNSRYGMNDNQNYQQNIGAHNYNNNINNINNNNNNIEQSKNQEIDEINTSQYTMQGNENYPEYTGEDPNYTGQYTNEDYQQYEQYDPSLYQQQPETGDENNINNQMDTQQYDNYGSNDYVDNNQHESVTQQNQ